MASVTDFCGSPFWNETEFSVTPWPKFTQCFQDLVLQLSPSLFMVLFIPLSVLGLRQQRNYQALPITALHAGKLFCTTAAAILTVVLMIQKVSLHQAGRPTWPSTYLVQLVRFLTFTSVACMSQYERRRGQAASRLQLSFWAFVCLTSIIPAYTIVIEQKYAEDFLGFVLFYMIFLLSLVCCLLNCWSEHPGVKKYQQLFQSLDPPECPYNAASALSRTFFFWIFKLIWTGFRRDLQESDLWLPPKEITCDHHMPRFEELWQQEQSRCHWNCRQTKEQYAVLYTSQSSLIKSESKAQLIPTETSSIRHFSKRPKSKYSQFLDKTPIDEAGKGKKKPSLLKVLFRQFWYPFFSFTWSKLVTDLATLSQPMLMSLLISYLGDHRPGLEWQGYCVCLLLLMTGQCRIAIMNFSMFEAFKLSMVVKSVLTTAIFSKALRMNSESKKKSTIGDIINLMSVDAQRIQEFLIKISFCHTTPIQLIIAVALIYYQIGASVFVGCFVLMLLIPLNVWVASRQGQILDLNLSFKDLRLRTINEVLNGIKALKLYAWEQSFQDRIQTIRGDEIATLLKIAMLYVVTGVTWSLAGFLVTLATFATYTLSDRTNFLKPETAFLTLAMFNIMKTPMDFMSSVVSLGMQAYVSVQRINQFLLNPEIPENVVTTLKDSENVISLKEADLAWDSSSPAVLRNLNLEVAPGQLVAVVGPVGSGKSSVLSAILGDMEKRKGTVGIRGKIAYVPQHAWIQNATVRNNILFGQLFKEKKYKRVLSACELTSDLTILSAGDQTEIGEKGINLSGGQKQRVSVARAVYQDRDVYLLDDPLSAVDAHVGKAMFEQVFGPKGLLKKKTRILVTHAVHFLPQVDIVVVMNQGQISELGTFEELLDHDGPFAQFLKTHLTEEQMIVDEQEDDPEIAAIKDNIWQRVERLTSDNATSGDEASTVRRRFLHSLTVSVRAEDVLTQKNLAREEGKLISVETLAKGRVKASVYLKYFQAGGLLPLSLALVMFCGFQASSAGTNFWLKSWTEDKQLANRSSSLASLSETNDNYLAIYGLFGLAQLVLLVGFNYLLWSRMVMAGRNLHSEMTSRIFKAPMSFFDTTPVGRIINRCSRDIEIVDNFLPLILRDFLATFGANLVTVVVILIESPVIAAVLVPVVVFFMFALRFYVATSRQLRRIEHVTRSPIYSHFSESISGATIIRAYGMSENFVAEAKRKIDYNTVYFFAASMALRWLSVSLDSLSNLVIFFSGFFQVVSNGSSGQAGLAVSYALQFTGSLPWMVRLLADFETNIVSVERIKEYSEVEQEADWVVREKRPPPNWPSKGVVEFRNLSVRYRQSLELVLHQMNIRIEGGQKVGIVGRTGAGKSSLSLSLFRLMEAASGCIIIDGINIAEIGLHDLRSRLTILPQDPVLFSGSLRLNLDPFNEFKDDEIWTALERAHLKQFVDQMPGKLMYECGEEGLNLSVGQRQLLCLARTLLRKTKILILDEATAAVDMQTDNLIQNTIRLAFENCTVIAIAHRLNTIMDYDRVLVLEEGLVKEFDSPTRLLQDSNSVFHSMAADANLI